MADGTWPALIWRRHKDGTDYPALELDYRPPETSARRAKAHAEDRLAIRIKSDELEFSLLALSRLYPRPTNNPQR